VRKGIRYLASRPGAELRVCSESRTPEASGRPGAEPIFLGVRGPTDAELSATLEGRVTRWLRKKGLLLAERQSVQAEPDALEQATQTALRLGQLAHVDERGQVVSPPARRTGRRTGTGAHAGYSLQTSTVVAAGDREGLERLLRYCARPALSLERLRETQDGRYAYELKYPSLGRTHLVLTPTELLARLSLLVAPPRYPLVRYGGLFAPAHGLRKAIVSRAPGPPREEGCCPARGAGDAQEANAGKEANAERPPSPSPKGANAGLAAALLGAGPEVAETATTVGTKRGELLGAATPKPWLDWATLLRRTYDLDVLSCPCGGRLRFIALVTEREAIAAPAGESRAPHDAAGESPRAVTDAFRHRPHAGLRVARGLSRGRGDVASGFARRCAEVRALRGESAGLGDRGSFAARGPARRRAAGWGVEAVWLLGCLAASGMSS
jgi:hypothetical protein